MKTTLIRNKLLIKQSPIHGYGVFAEHDIQADETIEECYMLRTHTEDPVFNYYLHIMALLFFRLVVVPFITMRMNRMRAIYLIWTIESCTFLLSGLSKRAKKFLFLMVKIGLAREKCLQNLYRGQLAYVTICR